MSDHVCAQPSIATTIGYQHDEPICDACAWQKVLADPERAPSSLRPEAFYGPVGEMCSLIAPNVPYDISAVLLQTLVACGSSLGPEPFLSEGAKRLHPNLFALIVGRTGGGKGMSLAHVEHAMKSIAPTFWATRPITSASSGEGLLKTICDPVWGLDSKGEPVLRDAGSEDKRVLLIEEEAGSIFIRVAQQEVLGKFLTTAWDSGRLMNVVKDSKMECATPHVSIIGHITPDELTDRVTSSHITSGFINRWTMALIRPTAVDDSLVAPEDIVGLDDAILRIRDGLNEFRDSGVHQFVLSDEADKLRRETSVWVRENEEPGAMAHLAVRFQSQTLKLTMVYAAVDGTHVISADHLRAARAVTAYSHRCARAFWGGVFLDDLTDDFMSLWRGIGYEAISLSDLSALFSRHLTASKREHMLRRLLRDGVIETSQVKGDGRPATFISLNPDYQPNTNDW